MLDASLISRLRDFAVDKLMKVLELPVSISAVNVLLFTLTLTNVPLTAQPARERSWFFVSIEDSS